MRVSSVLLIIIGYASEVFAQNIRDVKPPVEYPLNISLFLLILLILLIIGLLIFASKRLKFQRDVKLPEESKPDAWEVANQRLNYLKAQNYSSQGKGKEFFTMLSEIIRHYIEDRFFIRAPEMTTEEFLHSLNTFNGLSSEHRKSLVEFLNCSDMVKFAKYTSDIDEMEKSFILARKVVDETRDKERVVSK